jgi:chromosome segregation ATPase
MNEKAFFILACVFLSCGALLPAGCKSAGGNGALGTVAEHQKRISELENAVRDYESRIRQYGELAEEAEQSVRAVRRRAESIGDSAGRLEYLFSEYDRIVERIIRENRALKAEAGIAD